LIAFDTNILIYVLENDINDPRHVTALNLIDQSCKSGAVIPFPVIGELFNVCRKKKIANVTELTSRIAMWMTALTGAPAIFEDYLSAAELSKFHNLQYFDALIIAVASRAGATILLSEDMHDGLEIDGLRVINPFVSANETLLADYFGFAL
jgi:predicted nucleic acid-binding protein